MEATIQSLIVKERASNETARGLKGVDQCKYIFVHEQFTLIFLANILGSYINIKQNLLIEIL